MKVIFLDIDGVLNRDYCKVLIDGYYFVLDEKIILLKQLVDKTDAKIVLSSTWRQGWADMEYNIHSWHEKHFIALREKLKEFDIELYDRTPIKSSYTRGVEIDIWLHHRAKEPIESFVILDDMNGRYLRPHSSRLVRTSMTKGLTQKHIDMAIKMLETPWEKETTDNTPETHIYQWDGLDAPTKCEKQECILIEDETCECCGSHLVIGEKINLLVSENGDEYHLCNECEKKKIIH